MALADVERDELENGVRPDAGVDARAGAGLPRSAVPLGDGLFGLAGLLAAWALVIWVRPHPLLAAWLVLLATALPMLWRELARAPAAERRPVRLAPFKFLAGFVLAGLPFVVVHWQGEGLWTWAIAWIVVAPALLLRFGLEAFRNGAPAGGFPALLGAALLPFDRVRLRALAAPARLWSLKAFFIPLYGASVYALLQMALRLELSGPFGWLMLAVLLAYTIDLSFGVCGYLFASNDLVPTVRSTQTLLSGWIVCLACYGPIFAHWPDFALVVGTEITWPERMTGDPLLLVAAAAMLVLLVLYVSATVCFGLRFSNLSNRGLVATGPYRLMKHPAYFAHAGNAWIISLVFLPAAGIELGLGQWLVPLAFTLLYTLRSLTEERHMREDPDYVAYAGWISRHGLVAQIGRLFSQAQAQ